MTSAATSLSRSTSIPAKDTLIYQHPMRSSTNPIARTATASPRPSQCIRSLEPVPEDSLLNRQGSGKSRGNAAGKVRDPVSCDLEDSLQESPLRHRRRSSGNIGNGVAGPSRLNMTSSSKMDAQDVLERERQKIERNPSHARPDWIINLDVLEKGSLQWRDPRYGRIILVLGEPPLRAVESMLRSSNFENTLLIFSASPLHRTLFPEINKTGRSQTDTSSLRRRLPSFTLGSASASDTDTTPSSTDRYSKEIGDLVESLGTHCLPVVHVMPLPLETTLVGEVFKSAVEFGGKWRQRRIHPACSTRRSSHVSPWSASNSPSGSQRPSLDHTLADREAISGNQISGSNSASRDRRSVIPRSISNALGMSDIDQLSLESGLSASKPVLDGLDSISNPKEQALDAIINFLPQNASGSIQQTIENVLVITTTSLQYIPSSIPKSNTESPVNSPISSTLSVSLSRHLRSASLLSFNDATRIPQSLIHVLPPGHDPRLVGAVDSCLKAFWPQSSAPSPDAESRAYLLPQSVLSQPLKRAEDDTSLSALELILTGAASCVSMAGPSSGRHIFAPYLQDLRACRFQTGSITPEIQPNSPGNAPTFREGASLPAHTRSGDGQDTNNNAFPWTSSLEPALPITPPLDHDGDTSASSRSQDTSSPSQSRRSSTYQSPLQEVVVLDPNPGNLSQESISQKSQLKKGWAGKIFRKRMTTA